MPGKRFATKNTKALDIEDGAKYDALYQIWLEVDKDLAAAGLGMPSTFADHLSRINSRDASVVQEEKDWFEALIKSTHALQDLQYQEKDENHEHHSSQHTASHASDPAVVYPSAFTTEEPLHPIPRLRPYRAAVFPYFAVPNSKVSEEKFGYTTAQLAHLIRILVTVTPFNTFHDPPTKRGGDCIDRCHAGRTRRSIGQIVPDLVDGRICKDCDGEAFVIANYILARAGFSGQANIDSIPLSVLEKMVRMFLKCPIKVPYEHMLWAFGSQSFASNHEINGVEVQAWGCLQKSSPKRFKHLVSWSPQTPTKTEFAAAVEAQEAADRALAERNAELALDFAV